MKKKSTKVIISGGGTGGHIFPAISIANALKRIDPKIDILFIGAENKMEMEKVPLSGYKIIGLPIIGLNRKLSFEIFEFIYKLLKSMIISKKILKRYNPDVVVGVGGFASGPTLKSASKLKIKHLIQEQNSFPGITNRLLAKSADKICVAYDNMDRYFPINKIVKTGNPIRQDINDLVDKSMEGFKHFNLDPNKKVILVVGGSLGARTINESISKGIKKIIEKDIQLIWQTGKSYISKAKEEVAKLNTTKVFVSDFIYKMDLAFSVADIIVSRAGAGTISELCVVGKPIVLVPSPNVSEDHQTKNARALSDINAAILIKDQDAKDVLIDEVLKLIDDNTKCQNLKENISNLAYPNAADVIANQIIELTYE